MQRLKVIRKNLYPIEIHKRKQHTLVANPKRSFVHDPLLTNRSDSEILLETAMASPIAASATSSVNTSGVLTTLIPFSIHLGKSILSSPTLKVATISKAGKESIKLASAPDLVQPTTALIDWAFA